MTPRLSGIYPGNARLVQHSKSLLSIYQFIKEENPYNCVYTEEVFDKI